MGVLSLPATRTVKRPAAGTLAGFRVSLKTIFSTVSFTVAELTVGLVVSFAPEFRAGRSGMLGSAVPSAYSSTGPTPGRS